MSLIEHIRPALPSEWDEIWGRCDYATYFHSREWAEIWQTYTHNRIRPAARLIVFSDGARALLPISALTSRIPFIRTYVSSPAGTFGGWLSEDTLTDGHVQALIDYMLNKLNGLRWRTNPYHQPAAFSQLIPIKVDPTQTLPLAGDFESVCAQWTPENRRAIRRAMREGVSVKTARTLDDWRAYFDLYLNSMNRWGEPVDSGYGWSLFETMYRRNSPNIKLWLACYHEQIVAGALCVYSPRHIAYWHGAALADFFHVRPVNLLFYEAVRDACSSGHTWFDFNPSNNLEGVQKFKKSFGAVEMPSTVILTENRWAMSKSQMLGFLSR